MGLTMKWDYHRNHLQTMFLSQLDEGRFCDVTLACENGQTLKAHRSVLCACSTYFDKVLTNTTMGKDTLVILKDCKFTDMKLIIEFMYNGEIIVQHSQLLSLRKAASDLQIRGLTEAFATFMDTPAPTPYSNFNEASTSNVLLPMDAFAVNSSAGPSSNRRKRSLSSNGSDVKSRTGSLTAAAASANYSTSTVFLPESESMDAEGQTDELLWQVIPKTEAIGSPISYGVDYYGENEINPDNSSYNGPFAQHDQPDLVHYKHGVSLTLHQHALLDSLDAGNALTDRRFVNTIMPIIFPRHELEHVPRSEVISVIKNSPQLHVIKDMYVKRILEYGAPSEKEMRIRNFDVYFRKKVNNMFYMKKVKPTMINDTANSEPNNST